MHYWMERGNSGKGRKTINYSGAVNRRSVNISSLLRSTFEIVHEGIDEGVRLRWGTLTTGVKKEPKATLAQLRQNCRV